MTSVPANAITRDEARPEAFQTACEEAQTMWALLLILITSWGVAMNADLRFPSENECQAAAHKITEDLTRGGGQFRPHWSCVPLQAPR